jgi:hypothetical protein
MPTDSSSMLLTILKELAGVSGIENSRVSMFLVDEFGGNRYLQVFKHH